LLTISKVILKTSGLLICGQGKQVNHTPHTKHYNEWMRFVKIMSTAALTHILVQQWKLSGKNLSFLNKN